MALEFVGSNNGTNIVGGNITLSLTALTGGISSTAIAGDIVIAVISMSSDGVDYNISMNTSGYTEISDLFSDDSTDSNLGVFYKILTSTPDTSAVFNGSGSGFDGAAAIVYVWRGVDQTTPLDVTSTIATGINGSASNPPAITPITAGSYVIAIGGSASTSTSNAEFSSGSSSFSGFVSAIAGGAVTRKAGAGICYLQWTSGEVDPGAFVTGGTGSSDSWTATTIALRPSRPSPGFFALM